MTEIKKVAVLGAGVMGGGIAAACANAGCEVVLLDVDADAADAGKQKLGGGRNPLLPDDAVAKRISTGGFADDLARIADCDWICEAVIEDLKVKRELFAGVQAHCAPHAILSTNTSGIPLRDICAELPPALTQRMAVTHFFNPVHIMKLVELVPSAQCDSKVTKTLADFLSQRLDKGVVHAKDTVNFIGNRIGCFWMLAGLHLGERAMAEHGLTIEGIDALTSAPLGLPPTGLYGLIDLVGLDVMVNVGRNLKANLPSTDAGMPFVDLPEGAQRLAARGQLGRKTGGGFYKLIRNDDGSKTMQVFDFAGDQWRAAQKIELPANEQTLPDLFAGKSAHANFIREFIGATLCYAADLVPEISDDIVNIDRAMRWGFNWQRGPFELLDQIGAANFIAHVKQSGGELPAMLRTLEKSGAEGFYRNDGREYLTVDGEWAEVRHG